jgi:hypothetical protein
MKRVIVALGLLTLALLIAVTAVAQTGDGFDLSWWTVDGGGGTSRGGTSGGADYSLSGTAGQADAATLSGGGYTLVGGFWGGSAGAPALEHDIFIPLVRRSILQ